MSDATEKKPDVLVRATAPGFHNGRRRVGDVFSVPDGLKGKWFKQLTDEEIAAMAAKEAAAAAPKPKRGEAPKTLAESAKATGQASPNTARDGKSKGTLAEGGRQTGADLA